MSRRTPVRPRDGHLWTSAEAAQALRVGVSSIKRWTDEGELESVRTPGGHRRYTLAALHRFAALRGLPADHLPKLEELDVRVDLPPPAAKTLMDALITGDAEAVRRLVTPRVDGLARRATFLDRVVGDALREIGWRWERGTLGVDEEHRASHIVAEAIDRMRPSLVGDGWRPENGERPRALLACPVDEQHDLPLRLVRLLMEWSGWRTDFLGADTPWQAVIASVERLRPQALVYSARSGEPFRLPPFDHVVEACRAFGTKVVVGGEWARGGAGGEDGYLRFRTLRGFERWLRAR